MSAPSPGHAVTRVAIVQQPPALLDLRAGVALAVEHVLEAGGRGAQLVVFPESWLTGYPAWVFGMAGWDDADARHWFGRFLLQCPTVDDPALHPLREAARRAATVVMLGFNERNRPGGGSIYNSQLLIGPDGQTLNLHRKLVPTHTERTVWTPGDASGLRAVDTPVGRVGSLVCWEHWQPLIRQALHSQDEQVHVASWPDMPDSHALASRHYAFEGRCVVVAAAQYLTTADVPDDLVEAYRIGAGVQGTVGNTLFRGGSGVAGPDGRWLLPQCFDEATLLHAEFDLLDTLRYKHDLDVGGHYSRPDIFRLEVDRSVREGVVYRDDEPWSPPA